MRAASKTTGRIQLEDRKDAASLAPFLPCYKDRHGLLERWEQMNDCKA